jgi:hypothetical protein
MPLDLEALIDVVTVGIALCDLGKKAALLKRKGP